MSSSTLNAQKESNNSNNQLQLDIFAILKRRIWSLVVAALCGLAIGACYYLYWPNKYESTAQIMLMMNNSSAMATNTSNGQNNVSDELLATHIQIIQSPRIVSKALGMDKALLPATPVDESGATNTLENSDATGDSNVEKTDEVVKELPEQPAVESGAVAEPSSSPSPASESPASEPPAEPTSNTTPESALEATPKQTVDSLPVSTEVTSTEVSGDTSEETVQPSSESSEATISETPVSSEKNADGEHAREEVTNENLSSILANLPSIQKHLDPKTTAVDYVIDNLYVTSGGTGKAKKSHSLTVQFRHSDAEDSKRIVSAIVDQYELFVKEKFQDANSEAAKLIVDARSSLENELTELAEKYQKFRSEVPLLASNATGGNIYQQRYEELAAQLSKLQLDYDEAQGRFGTVQDALKNIKGTSPVANLEKLSLIDNENAQRLGILIGVERGEAATAAFMAKQPERSAGAATEYQTLLQRKAELSKLQADFGNNHPQVQALIGEIESTEKFLSQKATELQVTDEDAQLTPDDVMSAYVKMLENDLVTMKKRQADIENQMKIAENQAKELVTFELQNETMVRAREHREALYDSILERLREINMQGASSEMIHEVLSEPEVGEKVEPKGSIAALISMMSAGLIGLLLIVKAELSDESLRDPADLEAIFDSKIVAHIPTFSNEKELWPEMNKLKKTNPKVDPMLVVHHFPKSKLSEVFRAARTQLSFAVKGQNKSIAFTSANQGDGKSTVVANIAASIAQSGRSVILVDCDLRRPNTFRIFGLESDHHGLTDYIENGEALEQLLDVGIINNLSLLASGHISENPAETLTRPEFAALIESLKKKFDFVILDCPPLLPVSDPSIIATVVDSVVFVAKINKVSRLQIARCEKILSGVGKKVDAIVVNRADEAMGSYGYRPYGYEASGSSEYYRN